MPTYEFACLDCAGHFEIRASFSEKEKGLKPVCPECGSKKAEQIITLPMTTLKTSQASSTSSKVRLPPGTGCCGGNCGCH